MPSDSLLLFGDSITEFSFDPALSFGFGSALSHAYARKLDILNRGLAGYNSRQALAVLPQCIPSPAESRLKLITIFFGANDARIPETPGGLDQSVPIEEFKANLRAMVRHQKIMEHSGVRVVLITPGPVDERMCMTADAAKYGDAVKDEGGQVMVRRSAERTASYAHAVIDVGAELGVPVLDLWAAMIYRTGQYPEAEVTPRQYLDLRPLPGSLKLPLDEALQAMFVDGLHFSGQGYQVLYEQFMGLIADEWPELMPEALSMRLPAWNAVSV